MAAIEHPSTKTRGETRIQAARRQELIKAAIAVIADEGLSNLTLSKVAGQAGLTAAMVNFHFKGKADLLLATLSHISAEFRKRVTEKVETAGADPRARLEAIIEANFQPDIADPSKAAVWYAFWGESQAREEYQAICGEHDQLYKDLVLGLFESILGKDGPVAEALTEGLIGLLDGQWQTLLADPTAFDRGEARKLARAYLTSVLPETGTNAAVTLPTEAASTAEGLTLPAWTYGSDAFFRLEAEEIHLRNWQLACHISEIPAPGDYAAFELLGRRAFVVRDRKGAIRAFHNVCRHRAHAVVGGRRGRCKGVITCPYHGWSYGLDGKLRSIPDKDTFPEIEDAEDLGLLPIDIEVLLGFVFIRFSGDGPSVAERLGHLADELAAYDPENLVSLGYMEGHEVAADWKTLWDNYLENYHFKTGHPGLSDLTELEYAMSGDPERGTAHLWHAIKEGVTRRWSNRAYQALLPGIDHLPTPYSRTWRYVALFPGVAIDLYPEHIDYFQFIPVAPGRTRLRWMNFGIPRASRKLRALRYLNGRINTLVQAEDEALCRSVQQGLESGAYHRGRLSTEKEVLVRTFHRWIAAQTPVANLDDPPPPDQMSRIKRELRDRHPRRGA
jgi:phenylpropionate dioxygenase-like ring-hydroxylating dioxygenase large terminal subunit/AcrR family transcriptional regulator